MARDITVSQEGSIAPTEDSHDGSEAGSGDAVDGAKAGGTVKKRKNMPKPIAKACNECARRKARVGSLIPCHCPMLAESHSPASSVLAAFLARPARNTDHSANTRLLSVGKRPHLIQCAF